MQRATFIRFLALRAEGLLILILSAVAVLSPYVVAATMPNRSITVDSSQPSVTTTHAFTFDVVTPGLLGSIEFEYCDNTPFVGGPCNPPAGLAVDGASLASQTGLTGFSVHAASGGHRLIITRAPVPATPQSASYTFNNIVNPSDPQRTIFIRISTFASTDASGARTDDGAVVFSTARGLNVGGFVPPYLTFCAGVSVSLNCSTTTGTNINLGELSRTIPSTASSEFAVATNDLEGYTVMVTGNTMTSGNNFIPSLATNQPSFPGTGQYGLNLRRNTVPQVGQDVNGIGSGTPAASYGQPNSFCFVPGETVASSPLPSDYNKFTVSYLINVGTTQQPGIYVTTMTYIATASF